VKIDGLVEDAAGSMILKVDGGDSAYDAGQSDPDAGMIDCGGQVQCGVLCVDTSTDPDNCGVCGRTCVIPHAVPGCSMGECIIDSCELSYFDQDREVTNGCEFEDSCVKNEDCMTSCQTTGAIACMEGVATCVPPTEECNARDDNCDGICDEGTLPGCRHGVHRGYGNGHVYSDDINTVENNPYHVEFRNYFYLYAQTVPGTRPVFLCRKTDQKRFLTTRTDCDMNGGNERQIGFISPTELCNSIPLYQLYQLSINNHFYTVRASERDNAINNLGYTSLGVLGFVWDSEGG